MHRHHFAPCLALLLACSGDTTTDTGTMSADTGTAATGATTTATTTATLPTTGDGPRCGDGMLDEGEDCDGAELGDTVCADLDPAKPDGFLVCAGDCTLDGSRCTPPAPLIALNEVTSTDVGDKHDAIELYNPGGAPVDMSGWMLSDNSTFKPSETYLFPGGTTLAPAEYLVIHRDDLPFGLSNNNVETVTLVDLGGSYVDQIKFEGVDARVSYCRVPDGHGEWQKCDLTLGGANLTSSAVCGDGSRHGSEPCEGTDLGGADCSSLGYTGGTLSCTAACTLETGTCTTVSPVILNEVESTEDLIELVNSGAMPVDISGWILTDRPVGPDYDPAADTQKLIFLPDSILPPASYLVVAHGNLPQQHPFGLNIGGDTVTLLQGDRTLVDQVTYGRDLAVISYCRIPDGAGNPWSADCIPTFGAANDKP
jgi:hypothetical protein